MQTQVDWNWQIANRPDIIGQVAQINPDLGPFDGPILILDASTGIVLSAGPTLSLALASLTQQGVIGTDGYQQLKGPLFFVGDPAAGPVPTWSSDIYGATIQDSALAFYLSSEGAITTPNARLFYEPPGFLRMDANSSIAINSGTGAFPAGLQLTNDYGRNGMSFDSDGVVEILFQNLFQVSAPPAIVRWTFAPFFPPNTWCLDIESPDSPGPAYTLQGGTLIGQWGTLLDGTTVSGGIITGIGSSGFSLAGDVTGTSSASVVSDLQTYPLDLSTPPSMGDVLEWNGSAWVPGAGGGGTPTMISQAGGSVAVDGGGNVIATPASGGYAEMITATSGTYVQIDDTNGLQAYVAGSPVLIGQISGLVQLLGVGGSLQMDASGNVFLASSVGGGITVDNLGGISLNPTGPSNKLGVFGAGISQYNPALVTAGWTAGSSGNVLQTDDTFTGNLGTSAYTVGDLVAAFKLYGWLAL